MVLMNSLQMNMRPSDERWISFVGSAARANIFHHPAWINLLAECYGYKPVILTLENENNAIQAGLPFIDVKSFLTGRRWVSLPFTDYCAVLSLNDEALLKLTKELVHISQDTPHIEVRWALPENKAVQSDSMFVQHTLNLDQGVESILKSLHRTQRQNIKTAEKNNIQIVRGEDLDSLRIFYQLHTLTRRRQGVPVQPWRFFELLHERIIAENLGSILLAYAGDQCLAAGLFLHWNNSLIYKYASSSDEGQDMRPNHLLTWTAISWGCENGYKIFDFGRTDISNEGLRTFKNRWGTDETTLSYSYLSKNPIRSSNGAISSLMHTVIRRSPLSVCRLAGNLLYKHFG